MTDLLAVGEILIDFTPKGTSPEGNPIFERNPGGAPANLAVQAARLDTSAGFIGKAGDDQFGRFLKKTLSDNYVDTAGMVLDNGSDTTLAFVQLDATGNREFTFYRRGTADTLLLPRDIDYSQIDACKLLHFGSLSFTASPSRETVLSIVSYAKQAGKLISYDPNWRPMLWPNEAEGIAGMRLGLPLCDVIKVSEEELALLTDTSDLEQGLDALFQFPIAIAVVTAGPEGCYLSVKGRCLHLPTYNVDVVDTTGSGDSFFGAFLHKLLATGCLLDEIPFEELVEIAKFANGAGAICASRYGAIPAMPSVEEINRIIQ